MSAKIPNAILLSIAFAANAIGADTAETTRLYMIADAGVNFVQDLGFSRILGFDTRGFEAEIEPGIRVTLGVGYHLSPTLAAELEGGFAYNETKTYSGVVDGIVLSGSANAWVVPYTVGLTWRPAIPAPEKPELDYGQRFFQSLRPYVGAGAGAASVFGEIEIASPIETFSDSGTDIQLTYYAKAGLTYPLTGNVELGVQYRFYGLSGFTIKETESDAVLAHSVSAVLRIKF